MIARLDAATTLLLITSGCASYNSEARSYLVTNDGAASPATLRIDSRFAPIEQPIVGDGWGAGERRLHSFGRGRALADCGNHQVFA